jgi:hypothetical protein
MLGIMIANFTITEPKPLTINTVKLERQDDGLYQQVPVQFNVTVNRTTTLWNKYIWR